jgi:hypothetical protein
VGRHPKHRGQHLRNVRGKCLTQRPQRRPHPQRGAHPAHHELRPPVESPYNLLLAIDLTFENVSDQPIVVSSLLEFVLKTEEGYSASQSMHTRQRQLAEDEITSVAEDERGDRLRGAVRVSGPAAPLQTLPPEGRPHLIHRRRTPARQSPKSGSPFASAVPEVVPRSPW